MQKFTISAMRLDTGEFKAWNSFSGLVLSEDDPNVSDAVTKNEYVLKGYLEQLKSKEDVPSSFDHGWVDAVPCLADGVIDNCFRRADQQITDIFDANDDVSYVKVEFTVLGEDEHWSMLIETDEHKPFPI